MPTVEKTSPGRVYVRAVDQEFTLGDQADVSEADAEYLVEERADFELLNEDADDLPDDRVPDDDLADMIDRGTCPWCSEYEGDAVGQHASAAHPDEWNDYKEA